ncbi:MAG: SMC-Scp complex subunit ScpB, partial [Lysinibacillus sp.]|nr:SMC-Scp complex subunit ScpB [Lysinibacillus sp.]
IEDLRGVKSERPIQTLASRGLIQEVGRAEGTGRAILYGTTKEFLNYFGITDLSELPPLPEGNLESEEEETDLFMTKFQEVFQNDNE